MVLGVGVSVVVKSESSAILSKISKALSACVVDLEGMQNIYLPLRAREKVKSKRHVPAKND